MARTKGSLNRKRRIPWVEPARIPWVEPARIPWVEPARIPWVEPASPTESDTESLPIPSCSSHKLANANDNHGEVVSLLNALTEKVEVLLNRRSLSPLVNTEEIRQPSHGHLTSDQLEELRDLRQQVNMLIQRQAQLDDTLKEVVTQVQSLGGIRGPTRHILSRRSTKPVTRGRLDAFRILMRRYHMRSANLVYDYSLPYSHSVNEPVRYALLAYGEQFREGYGVSVEQMEKILENRFKNQKQKYMKRQENKGVKVIIEREHY